MKCFEGDEVVVNKSVETVVYTIKSIEYGMAVLQYRHGDKWVGGGAMPTSTLMKPTHEQLEKGAHYRL